MTNEQIVKLLAVSGALDVKTGQVDAGKLVGHWTDDGGHGWRRDPGDGDGGGQGGRQDPNT